MKCTWTNFEERLYDKDVAAFECDKEATHKENCGYVVDSPVCAEHKCRCSPTLEVAAQRKAAKEARAALVAAEKRAAERVIDLAKSLNCCEGEDAKRTDEMQAALEELVSLRAKLA